MNGILKKTLPIFAAVLLIIGIVITATVIKKSNAKTPEVSSSEEVYLEVKEELGGKTFTYSVTKGKIYSELKGQIGLSSLITMINKEVLKKETNVDGKSYWELAGEKADDTGKLEIYSRMDKDIYGDSDEEKLTDEEKAEKIHEYAISMYSGYGYTVNEDNIRGSQDLVEHYTLVLAKELYAKDALAKAIADNDEYFSDDDIETYYNNHYNKSYYAIVVPFQSSTQVEIALQQLGLTISTYWYKAVVEETEADSGIYKMTKGDPASVKEIVEAFIKLYNTVYAYKGEDALISADDYKVVNIDADKLAAVNEKLTDLQDVILNPGFVVEDYDDSEALAAIDALKAELEANELDTTVLTNARAKIEATTTLIEQGELPSSNSEVKGNVESAINLVAGISASTIVFDTTNEESPLFWDYDVLSEYDSTLPSKLNNSLSLYTPFGDADNKASVNASDATWYSKSAISANGVYYLVLKLAEVPTKELSEVRNQIIEDLTKEKVDEISTEDLETKVCELREKYNVVIYDKELQEDYIANCDKYSVEHKKNKKNSDTLIATFDGNEITVDDLFNYLDKTLGLASAISEITQQRLVTNTYFDKYYDAATGKWTDEGKEIKENISANIEAQRLNFLSGAYSYYGYTPSSDYTWEDFMFEINGVRTEKELAMLSLYSTVSNDYIKKTIEFVSVNEETTLDKIDFLMSEEDALASAAWQVLKTRMNDMVSDKFTVSGEHLLVSKYADPKDGYASGTPVSPMDDSDDNKWTDEEKALAKELIEKVYEYLLSVEGTYTSKLNALVDAYKEAPYGIEGRPTVVNSSNEKYLYVLEYPGGEIDLAKYKSAGLMIKFESLGSFTEGKMVKEFEDAAKAIWEQDKADNETSRITIYQDAEAKHAIETQYGYHLYINLSSTFVTEYKSLGEDVESAIPSLKEIRTSNMITALEALITDDTSDSDKEAINAKIKELEDTLPEEASNAISTYYSSVISEFTNSYFSALLQQYDIAEMAKGTWTNGTVTVTVNSSIYNNASIVKMIEVNSESTTKSNLSYLKAEDLASFNLTKAWLDASK
ncbi:MAG: hypothetical protein J5666_01495 [Bacilli bacterium]|nr:hypothetical protein [Bacilli bacterium]